MPDGDRGRSVDPLTRHRERSGVLVVGDIRCSGRGIARIENEIPLLGVLKLAWVLIVSVVGAHRHVVGSWGSSIVKGPAESLMPSFRSRVPGKPKLYSPHDDWAPSAVAPRPKSPEEPRWSRSSPPEPARKSVRSSTASRATLAWSSIPHGEYRWQRRHGSARAS